MGHSISTYLINKSELREDFIDGILDNKKVDNTKWVEISHGIMAYTGDEDYEQNSFDRDLFEISLKSKKPTSDLDVGKYSKIAHISTNYFGGWGEQSATLWVNGEKVYDEMNDIGPINDVLKELGVVKEDGKDEFHTIGLTKYRSNLDFNQG